MKLSEFSDILPVQDAFTRLDVSGLSSDSRLVLPGHLFFALTGTKSNGIFYVREAQKKGALACVVGQGVEIDDDCGLPFLRAENPRRALALCAARFYALQPETIVGVTGTSGKTSVVSFLRQIWESQKIPASSIGTLGVTPFRSRARAFCLTTPDALELHSILRDLAEEGVTHVAMEVSSHGLHQSRLDGVHLSAGAFTNLAHDHLDYHLTLEDYFSAKMRLFKDLLEKGLPAVIFADDVFSLQALGVATQKGLKCLDVGRKGHFLRLQHVRQEGMCQYAELVFDHSLHRIHFPLSGDFQLCNALVAAGLALALGMEPEKVFESLEALKGVPGRLEFIGSSPRGGSVYVDYAHKPDALSSVLLALRPLTKGRLIVLFGCGGERDRLKRSIMGKIASHFADKVIVTDDNPRGEDPCEIRAAILSGAPQALEIGDRREAIRHGVRLLLPGDTLIVAGKGHEENQVFAHMSICFSDHQEIRNALAELLP